MSVHVASQTRNLPLDHGVKDKPSGRDQVEARVEVDKPEGSSLDGIFARFFAECRERWIMQLRSKCRECRPWLFRQLRP